MLGLTKPGGQFHFSTGELKAISASAEDEMADSSCGCCIHNDLSEFEFGQAFLPD
jgi:hypothetical protein